jgi:hypothetical protein
MVKGGPRTGLQDELANGRTYNEQVFITSRTGDFGSLLLSIVQ